MKRYNQDCEEMVEVPGGKYVTYEEAKANELGYVHLFSNDDLILEFCASAARSGKINLIFQKTGEIRQSDESKNYSNSNADLNYLYSLRRIITEAIKEIKK